MEAIANAIKEEAITIVVVDDSTNEVVDFVPYLKVTMVGSYSIPVLSSYHNLVDHYKVISSPRNNEMAFVVDLGNLPCCSLGTSLGLGFDMGNCCSFLFVIYLECLMLIMQSNLLRI